MKRVRRKDLMDWLRHRGGKGGEHDDMQVRRACGFLVCIEGGLSKTIPTLYASEHVAPKSDARDVTGEDIKKFLAWRKSKGFDPGTTLYTQR